MRAIQYAEFGGPEVLHLDEVAIPEPGPEQVRVRVRVAGVNPADWKIRSGQMGNPKLPHRPGLEMSGIAESVGTNVSEFTAGDEVFGWARGGSYAEYTLASTLTRKPPELSWNDAAALPVAGEAALRGLRVLEVDAGDVLLIHGASGTVGTLATQLAVARGATVIGTTGDASSNYVHSLGATAVRYGEGLVQRVEQVTSRVDAVFDAAGAGVLSDSVTLRGGTERIVTIADPAAFDMGITFSSGQAGDQNSDVLAELGSQAAAGKLRIKHAGSYPLAEAAEAERESATGHSGGKITLEVN